MISFTVMSLASPIGQVEGDALPSALLTSVIRSLMVTDPRPAQSQTRLGAYRALP